jgi:hypothetical protein
MHGATIKKYKQLLKLFPVVLYECDIFSLLLRIKYRPKLFQHRGLIKIFRSKWEKATGEWEKISMRQAKYV